MNKVNQVWVVGNGSILKNKVHNKNHWSEMAGNLYIAYHKESLTIK